MDDYLYATIEVPEIYGSDYWEIKEWRIRDGEAVKIGDIIAEVENDAVSCELECLDEGILYHIGQTGVRYASREAIARVKLSAPSKEDYYNKPFPISLSVNGEVMEQIDNIKGEMSRESAISHLIEKALREEK